MAAPIRLGAAIHGALLGMDQFHTDQFRPVVEPYRQDAVSNTAADNHGGALFCVHSAVILGEEALIGRDQPADQGQP